MRPLSNQLHHRGLVCVAVGALVVACGGGGGLGPRGSGTAGAGGGWLGGDDGWGEEGGSVGSDAGSGGGGSGGRVTLMPWGEGGQIAGAGGRGGFGGLGRGGAGRMGRGGAGAGRGGAGGFGRGGAGGFGRGGAGGSKTCGPSQPTFGCPPSLCGNGVIDQCTVSFGTFPFCYDYTFSEGCDGAELGGQTCRTLGGFPTGTLSCAADCTYNTASCSECRTDPYVLRCGPKPVPGDPSSYVIASNDREVAVVSLAFTTTGRPEVRFTRFSSTLVGISGVVLDDPAFTNDRDSSVGVSTAVAARPSGWTVAAFAEGELFLHAMDADGQDVGRVSVRHSDGAYPSLIPRPDGGPLLVWINYVDYQVQYYAAVVAADGLSVSTPIELAVPNESVGFIGRGAYLDGVFFLPLEMQSYYGTGKFRIARISADGRLISLAATLTDTTVSQATLLAAKDQLHIVYSAELGSPPYQGYSAYMWQALDRGGMPASPQVLIGQPTLIAFPLGMGDDTILPELSFFPETLALVRLSGDGGVTDPTYPFAEADPLVVSWMDAVAVGSDVVVAWMSQYENTLKLARVRP